MIGQVSDIDLRLLRLFSAVVESGGFAPATARLNASESTISNQMKALEERIGARLCERGRAGFSLTPRGEAIYALTQNLLKTLLQYRNDMAAAVSEIGGTVTLGLTDGIATLPNEPVARAFTNFSKRHGNEAKIFVHSGTPRELERDVIDGTCQFALVPRHREIGGLTYELLTRETNLFYCGDQHPWFHCADDEIDLSDITKLRCIGRNYIDGFDEHILGAVVHAASVVTIEAATHLILSGAYVGFLPDHVAKMWQDKGQLRSIRPDTLRFEVDLCITTARGRSIEGAAALLACDLTTSFDVVAGSISADSTRPVTSS